MVAANVGKDDAVIIERMPGYIHADEFALAVKAFQRAPLLIFLRDFRLRGFGHIGCAKKGILAGQQILLIAHTIAQEGVHEHFAARIFGEELLALHGLETIECAGQREVFKALAVARAEVHALHEVEDRLVRAVFISFFNNTLHRRFAHTLHGCKAEAYISFVIDAELGVALVDIRAERANAHRLALVHELHDFVDVGEVSAHVARHVLRGVVGFEVRRLIGHPRVASGVALIESIRSKGAPVVPNLFKHLFVVPIGLSARDKFGVHVVQLLDKLLTHRLTQGIALAAREVCNEAREQHHLLLVNRDAVGVFKVFLHAREVVDNGFVAVLAGNELRDIGHWPRAIKGVHRNEVFEGRGLQFAQILLHARRLKLEGADGAPVAEELVSSGVVDRYAVDVEFDAETFPDVLEGFLDNGESFQSEEVHLN